MDLKRDLVKYVRDKAKSGYQKETQCFICGETDNLEFHHGLGQEDRQTGSLPTLEDG